MRFTQEEFNEIYSKVPRIAVELLIRNKNGLLLTKRAKHCTYPGQWHIPGGTVYLQESLRDACKRVAQEELGIKIKVMGILSVGEYPFEDKDKHTITIMYACKKKTNKIKLDKNATDYKYFMIPDQNTIPQHKKFI